MKRQAIAIGLAVLGLILFAFIMATVAAPEGSPLLQSTEEKEPNNDFSQANPVAVPGFIRGAISNTNYSHPDLDIQDYFSLTTVSGQRYQASLNVIQNPGSMLVRMRLYNGSYNLIATSLSSASAAALEWTAFESLHYIRVEALSVATSTVLIANYQLDVDELAGTPTPTNTPYPGADAYEPNDSLAEAYELPIATSSIASLANFYPPGDEDWYSFYVKTGRYYQANTSNLVGVDTHIEVYKQDGTLVTSDNDGGGGFASRAQWKATYDGRYFVRVTNLVGSGASDTYDLTVGEVAAPPTATPTPVPPSRGQIDRCEDNGTFDSACTIAANNAEVFNFVSPHSGPDNDYYRVWMKPGAVYNCRTSNLDPGVDPNMIVYDHNRNAIGGNDDVTPGDLNAAFSVYATYDGWLYLLIGYGDRTPSDVANSNYTLNCATSRPGAPTPTSAAATAPDATPKPGPVATPTPPPPPTALPAPELTVRLLATPGPEPLTTPAPRFVQIAVVVYYDADGDRQVGAGEGISGISVQAFGASTNQLLAEGFTDDRGYLEFTVAALGPVRVSIPYLGFSQLVAGEGGTIYVRVEPVVIVGGAE